MIPKQFIFISTLSVFGPVRERTYDPIMEVTPFTQYRLRTQ